MKIMRDAMNVWEPFVRGCQREMLNGEHMRKKGNVS